MNSEIASLKSRLSLAEKERDELKAAIELGQLNCDAAYNDLKQDRDVAMVNRKRAEERLSLAESRAASVERMAQNLADALSLMVAKSEGYIHDEGNKVETGARAALTAYREQQKALGN